MKIRPRKESPLIRTALTIAKKSRSEVTIVRPKSSCALQVLLVRSGKQPLVGGSHDIDASASETGHDARVHAFVNVETKGHPPRLLRARIA